MTALCLSEYAGCHSHCSVHDDHDDAADGDNDGLGDKNNDESIIYNKTDADYIIY